MQNIILIQHSQSEHHINNMSGGWTDSKLTDLGKDQASKIGISLQSMVEKNKETVLYSSDLLRASQTADIIGEQLNLKVHLDPDHHRYPWRSSRLYCGLVVTI